MSSKENNKINCRKCGEEVKLTKHTNMCKCGARYKVLYDC